MSYRNDQVYKAMELVLQCIQCKQVAARDFRGIHVCGLSSPTPPKVLSLNQRDSQSQIVICAAIGCEGHRWLYNDGLYGIEDTLNGVQCPLCLEDLCTKLVPGASWLFYLHKSLHQSFITDVLQARFQYDTESITADLSWEFMNRTNCGAGERAVLEYLHQEAHGQGHGGLADIPLVHIIALGDAEYFIGLHDMCREIDASFCLSDEDRTEAFVVACLCNQYTIAKWIKDNYHPIQYGDRHVLIYGHKIIDKRLCESQRFEGIINSATVLLTRIIINDAHSPLIALFDAKDHPIESADAEDIIVHNDAIKYEYYSPEPDQCESNLEVCGCQYTGWQQREEGPFPCPGTCPFPASNPFKDITLCADMSLVCHWSDCNCTVYYSCESKTMDTIIYIMRDNVVISAYHEPGCRLQLGDAGTSFETCQTDTEYCMRITNCGDVESVVLIHYSKSPDPVTYN